MNKLTIGILIILLCPAIVFALDTDRDGLSDDLEKYYYTDIDNIDTDGDGFSDWVELENDYSPHVGNLKRLHENDYDQDGLNDWLERWFHTDLGKPDTDGDGFSDYDEVLGGFDPTDPAPLRKFARRIEVDISQQRLYYFVDTVKLLNLAVSTGNPGTETPVGEFEVTRLIANKRYIGPGYNLPNVLWNMEFIPMYYIHGAYWHNDFGIKTHSHGCVNLSNSDAELLYKYVDVGMPITVTGTTPGRYYVGT